MNLNTAITGSVLKMARKEAKDAGVKLGKLTTFRPSSLGSNPWYEVYEDGELVWSGEAYNASEAKTDYINSKLS
jgi:hypothetical protein